MSAVAIAAALGLGGCGGGDTHPAAVQTTDPHTTLMPTAPPSPTTAPLPAPTALTDVLHRLADPNVAGAHKVDLIEFATPDDAAALDRFTKAVHDGGFAPLAFEARDLTWAQSDPGNVDATVVVTSANRQAGGDFTFPMEFTPAHGSWQLTRRTADLLLELGQQPAPTPTP